MPQRVADGLLEDAQHVECRARPEFRRTADVTYLPLKSDTLRCEPRLEPRPGGAEQREQVGLFGIQRVDREAQVGECVAQQVGHCFGVEATGLHHRQRRHDLAAGAVVHVAHHAFALGGHGAFALEAGPMRIALGKLLMFLRDAPLELEVESARGR